MSAFQIPQANYISTGNLNPSAFVTTSGPFEVAQSTTSDAPIGVSQSNTKLFNSSLAAASGDVTGVYTEGQECWLTFGDTVTAGQRLKPDSSGRGIPAGSTDSSGAVALESGAVGELHRVRVEVVPIHGS